MTLTATPQKPTPVSPTKSARSVTQQELEEFVKEQVLQKLGTPENLFQITAGNMWDNRWRVNVWCTHKFQGEVSIVDIQSIDYSYFIHTSEDGTIIKSSPEIEKEY